MYGPLQEAYRLTLAAQAATATILAGGAVLAKPAAARAAQDEAVRAWDEAARAWDALGQPYDLAVALTCGAEAALGGQAGPPASREAAAERLRRAEPLRTGLAPGRWPGPSRHWPGGRAFSRARGPGPGKTSWA